MTPEEYIKSILNILVKKFPEIRARYENHQESETHIVWVDPTDFLNDDTFIAWEKTAILEFIKAFPEENICFINDDIIKIGSVGHEIKGELYDPINS